MTTTKTILIAEDESDLSELLSYNLQKEGYVCRCVSDGAAAIEDVRRQPPDLIVLDRMLPKKSGDEVASALQREARTATIPIIMLTAKAEESDQLVGFALGATDYITKPFSMKVLVARVAAMFRRCETAAPASMRLTGGPIELDVDRFEVCVNAERIPLTTTEFRILKTLMAANGRVLDRARLIDTVLGSAVAVTDRTIDVHIAALRKKLGVGAVWVQTVRGVGYTFRSPDERSSD
jgi:two-component system phosphate regulon response regulator PhoB